jgi:hypothetical protein
VTVDDSTFTTPKTVFWLSRSNHTISTAATQFGRIDSMYTFKQWSDTGAISHTVSVTRDSGFTASFLSYFYLRIGAGAGGTVAPSTGWYPKDTVLAIVATPSAGHAFVEWAGTGSGSYSGANAFAAITMRGPVSESATFGLILPPPTLAGIRDDSTGLPTSPVLSWLPYSGASSYRLQVSTDSTLNPDGTFKSVVFDSVGITTTSVQLQLLANLTKYYWHVNARVGNDIAVFTSAWRFTTLTASITATPLSMRWASGYVFKVRWSSSTLTGPVTIKLTSDGGATYRVLKTAVTNTGSALWRIPDSTSYISNTSRLRVESSLNPNIFGETPNFAIISGKLPSTALVTANLSFPSVPTLSTEYRLFGGPGIVDTIRLSTFLSGNQKTDWRVYRDNGNDADYLVEEVSSSFLHTGMGFWMIKKGSLTIPSFSMVMPSLDSLASYGIPLHNGWNIIANPFDQPVTLQSILDANGLPPTTVLSGYDGSYTAATFMDPFKGYYYFNGANASVLKIPYPFGSANAAPGSAPQMDWKLQLSFESDINTDRENYIGIAPASSAGADPYDQHKPPLFLDQGFLYFSRPAWDGAHSRYSSDIRPSLGDGQTWEFEVSNPRKITSAIHVSGVDKVPAGTEVVLINLFNSTPVDLRKSADYAYQTVSTKMPFKVLVGTKAYVAAEVAKLVPQTFALDQNFPNPFNSSTSMTVRLPRDARIRLDIFSVLGQYVKTVGEGEFSAGVHTFFWDGTDASGEGVASGVYFYRLLEGKDVLQTKKMIITK